MLPMKTLWRKIYQIFTLTLSLCLLMTALGCSSAPTVGPTAPTEPTEPTKPTEPTEKNEPANVTVLTLNVAYYDGDLPNNQHLSKLNYTNQSLADYTIAERADRLESLLKYYKPDVFFLNEFNFVWWKEVITDEDAILKKLPQYTFVKSRSTGDSLNGEGEKHSDQYNIVFYDQTRFALMDFGYFVTYIHTSGRVDHCTWVKLYDKTSGQKALYAAIHLNTVGNAERAEINLQAATTAVEALYELSGGLPVILGGDFNTTETSRGYRTYEYMVNQAGYKDSRYAALQSDDSGTARIWGSAWENNGSRIDYIFVNGANVKKYEVASGSFLQDDTYVEDVKEEDLEPGKECDYYDISDHLPVISHIILKGMQATAPEK